MRCFHTATVIPAAILFTWLYNNTAGSLLPVRLFHPSIAVTGCFTPQLPTHTHAILSRGLAVAFVVILGPTHLSGRTAPAKSQL